MKTNMCKVGVGHLSGEFTAEFITAGDSYAEMYQNVVDHLAANPAYKIPGDETTLMTDLPLSRDEEAFWRRSEKHQPVLPVMVGYSEPYPLHILAPVEKPTDEKEFKENAWHMLVKVAVKDALNVELDRLFDEVPDFVPDSWELEQIEPGDFQPEKTLVQ